MQYNCEICTSTTCIQYKGSTGQQTIVINSSVYPAICDPGCATCSSVNPMHCMKCLPGYWLSMPDVCVSCSYPCLTCNASNTSQCLSCYSNSILHTGTCVVCEASSNCLTCSLNNLAQCTSCPIGYAINPSTNQCTMLCPLNCVTCSASTVCVVCASGFSATPSGSCLPCMYNCRVCSGTTQSVCLMCGFGFYLQPINDDD